MSKAVTCIDHHTRTSLNSSFSQLQCRGSDSTLRFRFPTHALDVKGASCMIVEQFPWLVELTIICGISRHMLDRVSGPS
jgi:hypothetical protein